MKTSTAGRLGAAAVIAALCTAPVGADLTLTTTTTMEGAIAAAGGGVSPKVVTRISGTKSRTDVDTGDQVVTTIIDSATGQTYVLRPGDKTAMLLSGDALAPQQAGPSQIPADVKPTGKTRVIEGVSCAEYTVAMKVDMATMAAGSGGALPPEAAAMLKDVFVRISGSVWAAKDAPGVADYAAWQQAAGKVAVAAMSRVAAAPGAPAATMPSGVERLVTGFPEASGIPYLTELTTSLEGSGQLVALMQQMGQMKIVSKVTSISTEPVSADVFTVPEGYTIVKQ
jgi:hypothetical protein